MSGGVELRAQTQKELNLFTKEELVEVIILILVVVVTINVSLKTQRILILVQAL